MRCATPPRRAADPVAEPARRRPLQLCRRRAPAGPRRARAGKRDPRAAPLAGVDRARARDRPRAPRSTAAPMPGYPFSLEVSIAYELGEEGLTVTTEARNIGPGECPFGAGQPPTCRRAVLRWTAARCTCGPPRGCSPTSARSRSGASPWPAVPTTTPPPGPSASCGSTTPSPTSPATGTASRVRAWSVPTAPPSSCGPTSGIPSWRSSAAIRYPSRAGAGRWRSSR